MLKYIHIVDSTSIATYGPKCGRWVFMVLASLICSSSPTGRMFLSSTIVRTLAAIRWTVENWDL